MSLIVDPDQIDSIDSYFAAYAPHLVDKATSELVPLHQPGKDAIPDFSDIKRKPFDAQAHCIAALIRELDTLKRGLLAGAMGTGKSIMAILTAHKHAMRSSRKGGSNGKYRVLILCPDHLVDKWRDEITSTIPGAVVRSFDVERKGYKYLPKELGDLRQSLRRGNRWSKPSGPEYYILGRDQSKAMPATEAAAVPRRRLRKPGEYSWHCPKCGEPVINKNGLLVDPNETKNLLNCTGRYLEALNPSERSTGLDRRKLPRSEWGSHQIGKLVTDDRGTRHVVRGCNEPLWTYTRKFRRWAPAAYIHQNMRGAFDYLIADEAHELAKEDTAQGIALGKLVVSCRYTLALTGTVINGYAESIFAILYRFAPRQMINDGHEWKEHGDFIKRYGRIERTVTNTSGVKETKIRSSTSRSLASGQPRAKEVRKSVPGIMPALFGTHLIGRSVFIDLDDIAENLPNLQEYVGGPDPGDDPYWFDCRIEMDADQKEEYKRIERILAETNIDLLSRGSMKLLGSTLATLLGYPDHQWDWKPPTGDKDHLAVGYWENPEKTHDDWVGVVTPKDLDKSRIYPKEQALIDLCKQEIEQGNQVWVFCQMTGKRDVQNRLRDLLEREGISVSIMRAKEVKTQDRLAWMAKEGKTAQVILSHPGLVQTGVDFFSKEKGGFNFNTIVFYQTGYNLYTLRQAARRAWRIGQTRDCRVYYLFYAETMQERAMELMSKKVGAATALDGQLNAEGLARMADDSGSTAMALAKALYNRIDSDQVARNWSKVSSVGRPKSAAANIPMIERDDAPLLVGNLAWTFSAEDFNLSEDDLAFLASD